jgi:hypothetical protein
VFVKGTDFLIEGGLNTLRIAYSGRLVQYQKRILDFVQLAAALDATDVNVVWSPSANSR